MLNFRKKSRKNVKPSKARQGNKAREQSTAIQGVKISYDGIQHAKIFAPCETPSWHTSAISHTSRPFSYRANQGAKISHTSRPFSHRANQGAKFIPVCETRCEFLKCQFRTPLFKVRNSLLAHECHFAHHKPLFAPCESRCEIFAQCEIECEIQFKVRNSQFKVRKFRTVKFKVRKFRTVKF